jgi:hypothetical protein
MFVVLGIGVALALLAFLVLPSGKLFVVMELSEAALLFAWAAFDFAKYLHDRSDEAHLRDGVFLVALGLLTIAILVVGLMRDAPWKLSGGQQSKIAEAVRPLCAGLESCIGEGRRQTQTRQHRAVRRRD